MGRSYFIAGTDTGVGKTYVANLLLSAADNQGLTTLGLKPIAAGCELIDGVWMNDDARSLMLASNTHPDYATVNPVNLREAMAPHIAAERENRLLDCAELAQHCASWSDTAEFCVIEGAGGWLVPLNKDSTMADLAGQIGCPVILVVGIRLGCINHSLLSANAIRQAGLQLAGWVANRIDPDMPVADENIGTLRQHLNAPLLADLPWSANPAGTAASIKLPD